MKIEEKELSTKSHPENPFKDKIKKHNRKIRDFAKKIIFRLKDFWPRRIWARDPEKYKGPKV